MDGHCSAAETREFSGSGIASEVRFWLTDRVCVGRYSTDWRRLPEFGILTITVDAALQAGIDRVILRASIVKTDIHSITFCRGDGNAKAENAQGNEAAI